MPNKLTYIIAAILLTIMAGLAFTSLVGDSATMDELSHIPAGYSYVSQKDMRINPEHPPLIKDLGGLLPYLFLNVNFPKDHKSWTEEINSQWWFGETLLYKSGNDADKIIFLARIPMIFILLLLGFYVFRWARELKGNSAGILALVFYSFSPTFLAHGRYVTTDIGAAAGFFISIYYFWRFLKKPSKKNLIFAGIAFGTAQLLKFTVFLVAPALPILAVIWAVLHKKSILKYLGYSLLLMFIGFLLVYPVYLYHTWNLPMERQINDTEKLLSSTPFKPLAKLDIWMASKPILRPYAQYFLGLLLVFQRGIYGHITYFLGEISAGGWKHYFPVVYLLKPPLAFHILTIIALVCFVFRLKPKIGSQRIKEVLQDKKHFAVFAMLAFIIAYWLVSLSGNLTLGVRHLSPIFPFMHILVSLGIIHWIRGEGTWLLRQSADKLAWSPPKAEQFVEDLVSEPLEASERVKRATFRAPRFRDNCPSLLKKHAKLIIICILFGWYIFSSVSVYPHYLTHFNELAGGPKGGSRYTVDSNLDWGQDLKRLKKWVEENNIEKIKIDYFGGGNVEYYFGKTYEKFDPKSGKQNGWLAISATPLRNGQGKPAPGFKEETGYYNWLKTYEPVTVLGNSIFVYHIK